MNKSRILAGSCIALISLNAPMLAAQTNDNAAQRWLAKSNLAPDFTVPITKSAWEKKRKAVRAELWNLLGDLPARPKKLNVVTVSCQQRAGFTVEKFQFDNGAGSTVPGYLLLPQNAKGPSPAILYCHWHGGQYDIGKEELFRTNATPVAAGPALAQRGYVVIAIDACCFGERNGQGPGGFTEKGGAGEMTASKFNLWVGRTLWGMIVRDDLMALDYLCSRPEVDRRRIGVTGISMGSTRAWWAMALDDRLKAGVGICCLTRYQNLIAHEELRQHGIYYFVPNLLRRFDTEAVVSLAAPRALLFQSGETDGGSPVDGIRVIEQKAAQVYQLYRKPENFRSIIYPGIGHVYLPAMWEQTVAWFDTYL